jgi:16S rRNA (cytidine1402-2'-O)-methyltransferase
MNYLYVVGTPIGNLEDITLRALKVLKSVDLILCEDTRTTKNLLTKHGIGTKTMSYHMHSKVSRIEEIIGLLKEGKNLALVSDAGTPGISDPGAELITKVREKCAEEIKNMELKIESVPGPSAFVVALSIAGVPCANFTFLGFLPHKKGRETLFKEIADSGRTMILYESPHRIIKTLESLVAHLEIRIASAATVKGKTVVSSPKKVTVCKELTKIFEEVISGSASEVKAYFESYPDKIKGEFVVIVS